MNGSIDYILSIVQNSTTNFSFTLDLRLLRSIQDVQLLALT